MTLGKSPGMSDTRDAADLTAAQTVDLRDAQIAALVAEIDGLHAAMDARATIEQAKGIIMGSLRCSADAAFAVLVAQSQAQNRKVKDIADELVRIQER